MAFYCQRGKIPQKKHTTFYQEGKSKSDKPKDGDLYREELFSTKGFSGIYSTKYHINMPTQVLKIEELKSLEALDWEDAPLTYYHFKTDAKDSKGCFIGSRELFLRNNDCIISTAKPTENTDHFYRNAYHHELIFVHYGSGVLSSEYGELKFKDGDYLCVPKGTTYQMIFDSFDKNKLLIIESKNPFEIPAHFRNEYGQLLEHAPYSERDFRAPELTEAIDKKASDSQNFSLILKADNKLFNYQLANHPYDVVGWDGYLYPTAFNIKDYQPIVGQIHLPPPVHIVYWTQAFVVCNFVPRLFDFHPEAVPAPYFHSNVDSDEILYYAHGNFMSRSGIEEGSITLHPGGVPHGPQPGKTEASVGVEKVYEYAVMIDTFSPIKPTLNVQQTMEKDYSQSWLN